MTSLEEFINEGINRSDYLDKVSSYFRQIVENWCLIRYCTLCEQSHNYKVPSRTKIHWMSELQATMSNIKRIPKSLKNKYSTVLDKVLENNDIVDKSSWKTILYRLEDKCKKEKINIPEPTNQSSDHYENDPIIIRSAKDFIKYGIKDVIYTIMDNFKSKPADKKSNYEKYTNTI